jgi:uncharacterized membrane protein
MKASRLDGLVDGIFAIVMTLLIIEIRVPEFHEPTNNRELWHSLTELAPLFLSYILSFSLLFTYWRAYCYVISNAKSFNPKLTNYNALFLFFIGLIPFTTHLLGRYNYTQLAILLYGLNIILIGISLFNMKKHIAKYNFQDEIQMTPKSIRHSNIRLLVPVFCSIISIGLSFISTNISMVVFTLLILFCLTQRGADFVDYLIKKREK